MCHGLACAASPALHQAPVLQQVVALLPSVAVEDLPALVRYLLLGATQDTAPGVVAAVRQVLCFEAAADPRLQGGGRGGAAVGFQGRRGRGDRDGI